MSLIEILLVVMLMTSAIIPIYSLLNSGRKRISRAEEKTLSTIVAVSILELFRTTGYEEADRITSNPDYRRILMEAQENHLDVQFEIFKVGTGGQGAETLSGHTTPLKQIVITVKDLKLSSPGSSKRDTLLTTLLVDPREALY